MATTGGATMDRGDMMRYAEYTPKTNARSDADIDRRLVSICIYTLDIFRVCQTKAICFFYLLEFVSGNLYER